MLQIVEQTREEKVAMYMKLPKKQIIEMLLENQRYVEMFRKKGEMYTTCPHGIIEGAMCFNCELEKGPFVTTSTIQLSKIF